MEDSFTQAKLDEAFALIKALAPKEAPVELRMIRGVSGLNIIKLDMLPADTIMVSKRLFDMIFEASEKEE